MVLFPLKNHIRQTQQFAFNIELYFDHEEGPMKYPNDAFDSFEHEASQWGQPYMPRVYWRRFKRWLKKRIGYVEVYCASCEQYQGIKRQRGMYFICEECLEKTGLTKEALQEFAK